MKKSILWLLFLTLLLSVTVPASADGSGPITGMFSPNLGPRITSIELLDGTSVPQSITPGMTYTVRVNVTDNAGIGALTRVRMKMWLDDSGKKEKLDKTEYFDPDTTYDSSSSTKKMQFEWEPTDSGFPFRKRFAYSTHWGIPDGVYPSLAQLRNANITSFPFDFYITVSRGATQAIDGLVWQIAADVTDTSSQTDYAYYNPTNPGVMVDWYGEMVVPLGSKVDWGKVPSGLGFADDKSHQVINGMEYFSNGNWAVRVKSSTSWERTGGGTAAVLTKDALTPNSFALKVHFGPMISAAPVILDSKGTYSDVKTGSNYGEDNNQWPGSYNNVFLKVNSSLMPGTYTGTLTYGIINR